jgi:hypothetical protein
MSPPVRWFALAVVAACARGQPSGSVDPDGQLSSDATPGDPDAMGTSSDAQADAFVPAQPSPFDVAWCPGSTITEAQVLSRFAPAASTATLGNVTLDARKRACQDQTGCQPYVATSSVPLHKITWTGSGFTFPLGADVAVPQHGVATCVVPGPRCSLTIDVVTTVVWPHEGSNTNFLWGVSPRIAGAQVQVGNWSPNPSGTYLNWGSGTVTTTNSCLFGTLSGRVYSTGGQYTEYQMVIWGQY